MKRIALYLAASLCLGCTETTQVQHETAASVNSEITVAQPAAPAETANPAPESAVTDSATPAVPEEAPPVLENSKNTQTETIQPASNEVNPDITQPETAETENAESVPEEDMQQDTHALHTEADWFEAVPSRKWYKETQRHTNKSYLSEYFNQIHYKAPDHTYALIAPIRVEKGKLSIQYYSYLNTAFEYSMTKAGEENYWPASTVKLAAAVMALLKLNSYGVNHQTVVSFTDLEGSYNNTVEKLCRDAIIPSNNRAYNRLMEIAGFDEINDYYLPNVFHFPKMVLQRRYVRQHPNDSLRDSPEISYTNGSKSGVIPERHSSGKMRPQCPRESNCTTLAELGEVMFRVVLHEELPKNRRLALPQEDIDMLRDALRKAPSCIGDGVAAAMGSDAIVYNKGGKVTADDRLEIAIVSSPDKQERYLIALSMPYYIGVEKETNRLAKILIRAMQNRQ